MTNEISHKVNFGERGHVRIQKRWGYEIYFCDNGRRSTGVLLTPEMAKATIEILELYLKEEQTVENSNTYEELEDVELDDSWMFDGSGMVGDE